MPDIILADALDLYRQKVSILKKSYEQEKYRVEQIKKSSLAKLVVRNITSVEIATYRDQRQEDLNQKTGKKLSPATVRLELSLLSNLFDIARIEWGYCDENPCLKVRKPKVPPGRDRRLTPREDRQILRYANAFINEELYPIVVLALETAMRQGEILGLRWEHVNLKMGTVHLPATKNGSKRDVPLSSRAKDMLIRMGVRASGRVFSYTKEGFKTTWRNMMIRLGIENLHFHDLRHEAVSRLFELGTLDMMEVAAISGHKSLAMLKRYTHLKAQKLVRKLEGGKSRGRQAIMSHLVPYPALVEEHDGGFSVRVLDFEGLAVSAPRQDDALRLARDALLRRLLLTMKEDIAALPSPDQYLDLVDEELVLMIDPLGPEEREGRRESVAEFA